MQKKKKAILAVSISLAAVILLVIAGGLLMEFAVYSPGTFYTLEEAYEQGYVDEEDLANIAVLYNNDRESSDSLGMWTEYSIKRTRAHEEREGASRAKYVKASDYASPLYYGEYQDGSYCVLVEFLYLNSLAMVEDRWVEIGGVDFHFRGQVSINRPLIWRRTFL